MKVQYKEITLSSTGNYKYDKLQVDMKKWPIIDAAWNACRTGREKKHFIDLPQMSFDAAHIIRVVDVWLDDYSQSEFTQIEAPSPTQDERDYNLRKNKGRKAAIFGGKYMDDYDPTDPIQLEGFTNCRKTSNTDNTVLQ